MANIVAAHHRLDGPTHLWWIRNQRKLGPDRGALRARAVERLAIRGGR